FLLWCQGHLWTLRAAETKYQAEVAAYNAQATKLSAGNSEMAETATRLAEIERQTERLRNDTAYWSKKNGVKPAQSGINFQWTAAKVEMPPVPVPPPESSAAFLAKWDSLIRLAGFGELALSIITLIFVRTRTATTNAKTPEIFPDELDAEVIQSDRTGRRFDRTRKSDSGRPSPISGDLAARKDALKLLREHLKQIAFYHPGMWFKADLIHGGVNIRLFKKDH